MFFFVKTLLIIMVFGVSTFIGYLLANKFTSRVSEINDLLVALDIFETKIKYTYDSLSTVFLYIADNLKTKIYRIFFITAEEIQENKNDSAGNIFRDVIENEKVFLSIKKDDIEILKELGVSLGQTDLEGQLKNIHLVRTSLKNQLSVAQEEKNKNFKMYRNMGVLSGLIIIIILL
ncbi:MAG: hypothetical protein IJ215_02050 [Clostridia bacterium]|nr:hypothetical protein [Clostridia bacterium]